MGLKYYSTDEEMEPVSRWNIYLDFDYFNKRVTLCGMSPEGVEINILELTENGTIKRIGGLGGLSGFQIKGGRVMLDEEYVPEFDKEAAGDNE